MALIKSISGIRGTIGGKIGESLTPIDVFQFCTAYGFMLKEINIKPTVVIGRDARISGKMISDLVASTLISIGVNVIDLGLSTTPSVEMSVINKKADAGIIITASHNPIPWNGLKFLNHNGEFISSETGIRMLEYASKNDFEYAEVLKLGTYTIDNESINEHIDAILKLPLVNKAAISKRNFKIAVDGVNSTGGIAVPKLLEALGVKTIKKYFCEPDGHFGHNPEPLPENLGFISAEIENGNYDLGIVVDPDVDRLCFICEDGSFFGEEYTLVAVADYVLTHNKGNTVSNLSSSMALKDITEKHGGLYHASAVGEVNVVNEMKRTNSVIGGEGNGGVIYPELHYGRDALVGIALFLSHLATNDKPISFLKASYPHYYISKNKIELGSETSIDKILLALQNKYNMQPISTIDGVKIEFDKQWVHLRKSNTEPIIRIYAESNTLATADYLANKIISDIKELIN